MTDSAPRPHPLTGQHFVSPVPPGEGWPDDPASAATPVARTAPQVRRTSTAATSLEGTDGLDAAVSVCRACRRLVRWREEVATTRRASFADQPYWGRPVPGFGDPAARVVVVGLAPAAHGANRTGRNFTGDSSGDWLYASLHRVGLAALPTSTHAGDGQRLHGTRVVAAVRCAPPANKPTPAERDTCAPWLQRELELLAPTMRVVVALGAFGWAAALRALGAPGGRGGPGGLGLAVPSPRPRFGHAAEVTLQAAESAPVSAESAPASGVAVNTGAASAARSGVVLLGSYHPSQHNTFTGRLTPAMLDDVLGRAAALAGLDGTDEAGGGRR